MTVEIVFPQATESYDDRVTRLSNLNLSTNILNHWGLNSLNELQPYLNNYNDTLIQIDMDNGAIDSFNESGNLVRTWPSESAKNNANSQINAYKSNISANIYFASNGAVMGKITLVEYLDNFLNNSSVTISN